MDAQGFVVRNKHSLGGVAPGGCFLEVDTELGRAIRVVLDGVGRRAQVPLCHQVGVDVVVGNGAVFVGAGDSVDPKPSRSVVVA